MDNLNPFLDAEIFSRFIKFFTDQDFVNFINSKDVSPFFVKVGGTYYNINAILTYLKNRIDAIKPPILSDYATKSYVNSLLVNYATINYVKSTLTNYVDVNKLNNMLTSYVTKNYFGNVLKQYVTASTLNNVLTNYASKNFVQDLLSKYITRDALNSMLTYYVRYDKSFTFNDFDFEAKNHNIAVNSTKTYAMKLADVVSDNGLSALLKGKFSNLTSAINSIFNSIFSTLENESIDVLKYNVSLYVPSCKSTGDFSYNQTNTTLLDLLTNKFVVNNVNTGIIDFINNHTIMINYISNITRTNIKSIVDALNNMSTSNFAAINKAFNNITNDFDTLKNAFNVIGNITVYNKILGMISSKLSTLVNNLSDVANEASSIDAALLNQAKVFTINSEGSIPFWGHVYYCDPLSKVSKKYTDLISLMHKLIVEGRSHVEYFINSGLSVKNPTDDIVAGLELLAAIPQIMMWAVFAGQFTKDMLLYFGAGDCGKGCVAIAKTANTYGSGVTGCDSGGAYKDYIRLYMYDYYGNRVDALAINSYVRSAFGSLSAYIKDVKDTITGVYNDLNTLANGGKVNGLQLPDISAAITNIEAILDNVKNNMSTVTANFKQISGGIVSANIDSYNCNIAIGNYGTLHINVTINGASSTDVTAVNVNNTAVATFKGSGTLTKYVELPAGTYNVAVVFNASTVHNANVIITKQKTTQFVYTYSTGKPTPPIPKTGKVTITINNESSSPVLAEVSGTNISFSVAKNIVAAKTYTLNPGTYTLKVYSISGGTPSPGKPSTQISPSILATRQFTVSVNKTTTVSVIVKNQYA